MVLNFETMPMCADCLLDGESYTLDRAGTDDIESVSLFTLDNQKCPRRAA